MRAFLIGVLLLCIVGLALSCAHHDKIACNAECVVDQATCSCTSEDDTGGSAEQPTGALVGAAVGAKKPKENP